MADVFNVAEFFIQTANQNEDDQITNLKLNKLLYFVQGTFLSRTGRPLFDNPIEAWTLGPVVRDIYQKYKVCGKAPISSDGESLDPSVFSTEELETLLDVMREFGQYTGYKLVNITHRADSPWSKARAVGKKEIDQSAIHSYFTAHPVPRLSDRIGIPVVSKAPADWYDPAEDAEWEAYL